MSVSTSFIRIRFGLENSGAFWELIMPPARELCLCARLCALSFTFSFLPSSPSCFVFLSLSLSSLHCLLFSIVFFSCSSCRSQPYLFFFFPPRMPAARVPEIDNPSPGFYNFRALYFLSPVVLFRAMRARIMSFFAPLRSAPLGGLAPARRRRKVKNPLQYITLRS